ncbi:MAG: hypothetical protein DMG98_22180 [Acidobacteria bacterium]|nr:MAG: hypothetical protein DMG98_22180 [Acidobacteriota bacterium]
MKARTSVVSRLGLIALFAVVLFSSGRALAQENSPMAAAGLGIGLIMVFLIIGAAAYVYMSLALQTIADKTKTENSWLAWIPIANLVLMLNIAKKPMWWIILFFVPIVNIVIAIMVWMAVAEARGKPSWWGILTIVPVANLIVPGVLAWSD